MKSRPESKEILDAGRHPPVPTHDGTAEANGSRRRFGPLQEKVMLTLCVLVIVVIAIVALAKRVAKEVLLPPGVATAVSFVKKAFAK
jgi:hypothetical protein